jgi:hypothetical protein
MIEIVQLVPAQKASWAAELAWPPGVMTAMSLVVRSDARLTW